jgi:hypothetical protein
VLRNVRDAAETHHRVWAVEYDLSGADPNAVMQQLSEDWEHLSGELHVTSSTPEGDQEGVVPSAIFEESRSIRQLLAAHLERPSTNGGPIPTGIGGYRRMRAGINSHASPGMSEPLCCWMICDLTSVERMPVARWLPLSLVQIRRPVGITNALLPVSPGPS